MRRIDEKTRWLGIKEAATLACMLWLLFGATPRGQATPNEPAITTGSAAQARD
jgi:hypothetical protein